MQLVFLGSGGYHPSEQRQTAGVLLPEVGVLFDAGTSLFRLPRWLQTSELQIFLSHAHLDHIAGLTFLLPLMLENALASCRVYGRAGTLHAVREHLFAEPVFPVEPPFDYVELTEEISVPGGGRLTHLPLQHPGGSLGFRIDWPECSMAYITDTIADGSYTEFVRNVDVLIHECYFPDEQAEMARRTGHSHTTPVAQVAQEAGAGRLLLVHVDPRSEKEDPVGLPTARAIFPATEIATDGMVLEF